MSSTPFSAPPPDSKNIATLGEAVRIIGEIVTKEDLQINGNVEGSIEAQSKLVIVGRSGRVQATVRARDIVVLGHVMGDVEATGKVELGNEARLAGNVRSARIVIEDGAQFKGNVDIVRSDAAQSR